MGIYTIKKEQLVNASIDDVWSFFSDPNNLSKITPEHMGFEVTSEPYEGEIYPGQIITYKVSPVLNIKMFWMTEITHVVPKKIFVDEQRKGPYKIWHHQHLFEETNDGVKMTDIVHYQPPMWILGNIANNIFIRNQLNNIFDYRKKVVDTLFLKNM